MLCFGQSAGPTQPSGQRHSKLAPYHPIECSLRQLRGEVYDLPEAIVEYVLRLNFAEIFGENDRHVATAASWLKAGLSPGRFWSDDVLN